MTRKQLRNWLEAAYIAGKTAPTMASQEDRIDSYINMIMSLDNTFNRFYVIENVAYIIYGSKYNGMVKLVNPAVDNIWNNRLQEEGS